MRAIFLVQQSTLFIQTIWILFVQKRAIYIPIQYLLVLVSLYQLLVLLLLYQHTAKMPSIAHK